MKVALAFVASVLFITSSARAAEVKSPIVSLNREGKLTYDADERGNRVPDFSTCGYAGANRPIPDAPIRVVVEPKTGDATARIQQALDYVAGLPADTNGLRGAVLLLKGRYEVAGGLRLTNSGVVLRGQGAGATNATTLVATGTDRRTLISFKGPANRPEAHAGPWKITDDYVPVGATSFRLEGSGLKPGLAIRVVRSSVAEWIESLDAAEFGGGIGGGWKPGTRDIAWNRVITEIDGDLVTLDAPITTALEKRFGGGRVESAASPGITEVGVENLCLESAFDSANPKDENHSWFAITMENTADAWVRQVNFKHFAGSAVALYESCRRVTVQDCLSLAPVSEEGGYRRHTFFTMGQQTLFLRCYAERGRHDFSAGHCAAGPNAFVQCESVSALGDSGPLESWASGVLYDNVVIDGNALTLGYRPGNNAGIGWSAANCVLWNCSAAVIRCSNPPGAQNWSFGSWAGFEGDGLWRSSNDFMSPDSLFAAQLAGRLGVETAGRLKLMPRPHEESSNPPLDKAQELAADSHQPAPRLKDYIADAGKRDPIPGEPGDAKRIEDLSSVSSRGNEAQTSNRQSTIGNPQSEQSLLTSAATKTLLITNGWLTMDGKLFIGGSANVSWWRGNIRPGEAPSFGFGVTRFVPGRAGPGFTDDLNQLADTLIAGDQSVLDYNYGLWYDRRRDDHERVRRMTGDVLPPFYEQPFARSGQDLAWDGLSKYDLTKYNPWYWSRLREFAEVADRRGVVLFHQNYFQHNILEAGAHWADCPWRSANNINSTGFPEPPPYAGDKRIFQAELFYDVTNSVRRDLHRRYIRKCLDNFATNANVIQFTSAEFTGPLRFVQFWLDTVDAWETDRGYRRPSSTARGSDRRGLTANAMKPLIALSATKDVQDAILADAKRGAVVDVIDFRYWWRTDKGEFAPPGGKNLAPRQFERQWRGGRPTDVNLARMAAEYRAKYSTKALICDFDSAGWAWVCAGGSMPRLPRTTDAKLLEAIPKMQPWDDAAKGTGVLRETGRQFLVHGGGNSELDLSNETGEFRVNTVNARTGGVTPGELLKAGGKVKLPNTTVVWLVKE
jgi:uncharacterized protein DUF6298